MSHKMCDIGETFRLLWYERVYLQLYKVADTPFRIQGDILVRQGPYFIFNYLNI